jgi:tyrosinase
MAYTRRGILSFTDPWDDTLLWYAKAVSAMSDRPIAQKTSWRYLAAMHGFNQRLWKSNDYFKTGEKLPPSSEQDVYWDQCQHQSWYFWPWHRAYLLSFESIVRDAIVTLGGPKDWALPYWNYSASNNPNALNVPKAFMDKYLPGTRTANPLHVEARYGTSVPAQDAELTDRIADNHFTGTDPTQGSALGVGGPQTPFSHSGEAEGLIEAAPHDLVHGDVGGRFGLMSDPRSAALDPIFWVHHANIDRLWQVWLDRDPRNKNPTDSDWRDGPADRPFAVFGPDGKDLRCTPKDVQDLSKLGYTYDDTSDPLGGAQRRALRLSGLGLAALAAPVGAKKVAAAPKAELLGASSGGLKLGAKAAVADLKLAPKPTQALRMSFTGAKADPATPGEPDRVFLHLENIKGKNDSATFDVFLSPKGAKKAAAVRVGAFSLFGMEAASDKSSRHGGRGLTKILEVTKAVDAMHLQGDLDAGSVSVRLEPRDGVKDDDAIKVGQISLHRQGQ